MKKLLTYKGSCNVVRYFCLTLTRVGQMMVDYIINTHIDDILHIETWIAAYAGK